MIAFEGWFQKEKAAIRFCEHHADISSLGYLRYTYIYRPSSSSDGFSVFRVHSTNKRKDFKSYEI